MALSRRGFLKQSAIGAGMLAAPAIISSKALASSGELNFAGWAGYPDFKDKVFPAFEAATGIKVNFTEFPGQDDMFAAAKVAAQAGGMQINFGTLAKSCQAGFAASAGWRAASPRLCPGST